MTAELCYYEINEQTAIVTIDNPPMNALGDETKQAIAKVFQELDQRWEEIRAVILTGAGGKAFVAGADIKGFLKLNPETAKRRCLNTHAMSRLIEDYRWPVIAAIDGYCLGGGLELALCCDIRYATERSKLGFPEANLGIFPGNGGTVRSLRHISLGKLKELVFTGEMISAREALTAGLLQKVTPDGQVMEAALATARRIAGRGPLGVAAAKRSINRAKDLTQDQALDTESDLWAALAVTEDMKEGAGAFLEKRQPEFKCR